MEDIALEQKRERTKSICFAVRMDFAQPSRLAISQPVTLTTGLPGQVRPSIGSLLASRRGTQRVSLKRTFIYFSSDFGAQNKSVQSPLCCWSVANWVFLLILLNFLLLLLLRLRLLRGFGWLYLFSFLLFKLLFTYFLHQHIIINISIPIIFISLKCSHNDKHEIRRMEWDEDDADDYRKEGGCDNN